MEVVLNLIKPLIELYAGSQGWLVSGILFVGSLRLLIKPLMSLYEAYVQVSSSTKDDIYPSKIKNSKWYKILTFSLDWLASLKIKK